MLAVVLPVRTGLNEMTVAMEYELVLERWKNLVFFFCVGKKIFIFVLEKTSVLQVLIVH